MAFGAVILLVGGAVGMPAWIPGIGAAVVIVATVSFAWTNRHFALRDADSLRTEKFILDKLALQKSLVGDNERGTRETIADDEVDRENAIDVGSTALTETKPGDQS